MARNTACGEEISSGSQLLHRDPCFFAGCTMADDTGGAPGVSDWQPKLNTENGAELQLRLLGNSGYPEKRRGSHPETLVTKDAFGRYTGRLRKRKFAYLSSVRRQRK
jgi:hypothetical protein